MGILYKLSYSLRRFQTARWSLERWLATILTLWLALALLRWLPGGWPLIGSLAVLLAVLLLGGRWAQRQDYVVFRPDGAAPPIPVMLPMSALTPVRATGRFEVEGEAQRFSELTAQFQSFELRQHVIMGRIVPLTFLRVGRWPAQDVGMWYIFIAPRHLLQATSGRLWHGRQPRPALRLLLAQPVDEENGNSLRSRRRTRVTNERIYLSFDSLADRQRIWANLLADAPQIRRVALIKEQQ